MQAFLICLERSVGMIPFTQEKWAHIIILSFKGLNLQVNVAPVLLCAHSPVIIILHVSQVTSLNLGGNIYFCNLKAKKLEISLPFIC